MNKAAAQPAPQRLLVDALDCLPAAVLLSDPAGHVVLTNSVWRAHFGQHVDAAAGSAEIIDRILDAGLSPATGEARALAHRRVSQGLERGEQHEICCDGRWFIVSRNRLADGHVLHMWVDVSARKQVELTELRRLEHDRLIMQHALEAEATLPVSVADATQPDMPLIYVNPSFERLTGYSRSELLGRNTRFLQAHLRDQPGRTELREAIAQGRSANVTLHNVRKNGTLFSNAVHLSPMRSATGELTHYIGVHRDVTEQNRAADKLRLSEELYRSVATAISDGMLVVTPQLGIIAINNAARAIVGLSDTHIVGPDDAWPFELLDAEACALPPDRHPVSVVARSDAPLIRQALALRRSNNETRWIELSAHPLQLRPQGSTYAVVLTFRDVTQQRAAEQALAAAEQRWNFALEGVGDGVWDWDLHANKIFYSKRWKEMLGHADAEIGDSFDEWTARTHPDDLASVMANINRHLRGETAAYEVEHRMRHQQGHTLWVRARGNVVRDASDGQASRFIGTLSDITSNKQSEQILRDKQAAELANRAKSEFLSRMSHEMRTPLNAVIGFSQIMGMREGTLDKQTFRDYAGHVLDAGQHLLALIEDVLDLQKIEQGALALQLAPLDLHSAAARAIEFLRPSAQPRQVSLDNRIPVGTWVQADAQRLRQVLLNVASNAVKYNHPDGQVVWRLGRADAGRVALCVEDDGAGMTPEQMTRLFQPFERLGRETSHIEGTGLGLIIARSLMQAIGGHLEVSSEAGQGTCVRLDLRAAEAPAAQPGSPAQFAAPAAAQGLRMLYVEDNRINAILFEQAMQLHENQIELRVAENGEQALELARDWSPQLLVLDSHLPGHSGFEVLRQLRELPGLDTVPAYMCSADAMPEDVQRAYEAGFVGYWTKPIQVSAVWSDIAQWLERKPGGAAPMPAPPAAGSPR